MRAAAARLAATAARRATRSVQPALPSAAAAACSTSCPSSMPTLRLPARSLVGWAGSASGVARPFSLTSAARPVRPLLHLSPPPSSRALHPPPTAAFANLPGGMPEKKAGNGGAGGGGPRGPKKEGPDSTAAAASAGWDASSSSAPFASTSSVDESGPESHFESPAERAALARELHTVSVAITANAAIFLAKMVAFFATGSSAMLAEGIHSAVDTCNQALLRVGVVRSRRAPTAAHPYGFMKDKFVFSLISACGIFCLGAGANVMHGVQALSDTDAAVPPTHLGWALGVLGVSALVEGYSLAVAVRSVSAGAAAAGLPFREYVQRGVDPTSVAVMLEDGAAVAGLGVAGIATLLTAATGSGIPDAAGSLAVGLLMGVTAVFLIGQNRSLLIGRAMHPVDMQRVLNHLARDPVVRAVFDAKSEEIGPGESENERDEEGCGVWLADLPVRVGRGACAPRSVFSLPAPCVCVCVVCAPESERAHTAREGRKESGGGLPRREKRDGTG